MRSQVDPSPACAAEAVAQWISPSESRSGRPRWTGLYVVGCVVPQAWSAHSGSDGRRSHRRAGPRVPRSGRPREGGRLRYARPPTCCCWLGTLPIVSEPVLAMLERIGGQVELSRVRLPESGEVGQVAQDVRVGNGFGDLSVVGGVSAQGRDRPRCGGRVRPCPQGCGGEHRLRADLEQHFAAQIGKGAHALGEFDRLARVTAPIGAIEFHAPAERGAGAVVNQNPLWRS